MRKVHFEFGSQRHRYVFDKKDDCNLKWTVDRPMFLDEFQNLVQVGPNVLLNNRNQKSQLLEKELFKGNLCERRKTDNVDKTRNDLWES